MFKEIQDPWESSSIVPRTLSFFRGTLRSLKYKIFPRNKRVQFFPPLIDFEGKPDDSNIKKRALLSYVINPFYEKETPSRVSHSNQEQTIEIYRAFRRLGYGVDIIDYRDTTFIPAIDYDVFFGMGENAERINRLLKSRTVKIYYGTGSHWEHEKRVELARRNYLKSRRGLSINPFMFPTNNQWAETADAVVLIGNRYTASTYPDTYRKVYTIDNSFLIGIPDPVIACKDFSTSRKNFFWMGSSGLLRRGLDLVLEAFINIPDLHLWVCGPIQNSDEREFVKTYRKELFHTPNIHPIGWLDVQSQTFQELSNNCAFFLSTTCTEGMSGGAINCMRRGLIPLVTRDTGIDIKEDFGFIFENDTVECIQQTVRNFSLMDKGKLQSMSNATLLETKKRYSIEAFAHNIEVILSELL